MVRIKPGMLIISMSHLESDPRVYRQIEMFEEKYNVTTLGYSSSNIKGVKHISNRKNKTNPLLRLRYKLIRTKLLKKEQYDKFYWLNPINIYSYKKLVNNKFDIIIANDLSALPLALKLNKDAKVLCDAHEYAPKQNDTAEWNKFYKGYYMYLCNKYLPEVDHMVTVSDGIAEEYRNNFNIVKPDVITNATDFKNFNPSHIDTNKIRIIHHGVANRSRELEKMIYAMDQVDSKYQLDLMLVETSSNYLQELKEMVSARVNVNIIKPVNMKEIVSVINKYDIGLYSLPPNNFNQEKALPNKIFEFVQARLMLIIGPSEEMRNITRLYNLGKVTKDFKPEEIANTINSLSVEEIYFYKERSHKAASKLNSYENKLKMESIVLNMVRTTKRVEL